MNNRTLNHIINIRIGVYELSIDLPEELKTNSSFDAVDPTQMSG